MDYRILHPEAFPAIELKLNRGESVNVELDSVIATTENIKVEKEGETNIFKGIVNKVLSSEEKLPLHKVSAVNGAGRAVIGNSTPGGIFDVQISYDKGLVFQKASFLAATEGVVLENAMKGLYKGVFPGEGFFFMHATGRGMLFVRSYGSIYPIRLSPGKEITVSNAYLVAWDDNMTYSIEQPSKGFIENISSGDGLVCRFRGPGTVFVQTMSKSSFTSWMRSVIS